mmetsp:Transcript_5622/g.7563  ORF Transcript_5622/g.7563 Transcript_5622/m.7563 type:complete len:168 (+) Transcript_5622:370-873(+)
MMNLPTISLLLLLFTTKTTAFQTPVAFHTSSSSSSSSSAVRMSEVQQNNAPRPDLPIEWEDDDAAFADDEDWITENVPGKMVLGEIELAQQVSALSGLEEKFRKERVQSEYDAARLLGWTGQAETYNGRFAMFFLVVGLLTEYWTGVTIPGQVEEMLRVGGFIDVDF